MRKAIKKFGLLIAMLFASIEAYSYDFTVDGIYYSVISLPDMTCKVVQGDEKYKGDIVIPSEVTYNNRKLLVKEIEGEFTFSDNKQSAFAKCDAITSVFIPPSVTKIGAYAFYGCKSLTTVTIPNSVEEIGIGAFCNCESLTSVTISNSVTKIESSTFSGCMSLTSITIPNSVTVIEYDAFKDCQSLIFITIPNSVISIGARAFENCQSLNSVTIPNSVTTIEWEAFSNCKSLTSITIPNSVIYIGRFVFANCQSLESITLSDSLIYIAEGLFKNCESLKELVLPGSIQFLTLYLSNHKDSQYGYTFENCNNLKKLSILNSPEILLTAYYDDFDDIYRQGGWDLHCDYIETLFIDRNLKNAIPWNCLKNLEKLELGESIQEVQVENISKLEKLKTIESHALVPPKVKKFSNPQYMTANVYVPAEALEAYKSDPVWGQFWNLQASGVEDLEADSNVKIETGRYDINGRPVPDDYDGLVIVKFSDGSCKKMINRNK